MSSIELKYPMTFKIEEEDLGDIITDWLNKNDYNYIRKICTS